MHATNKKTWLLGCFSLSWVRKDSLKKYRPSLLTSPVDVNVIHHCVSTSTAARNRLNLANIQFWNSKISPFLPIKAPHSDATVTPCFPWAFSRRAFPLSLSKLLRQSFRGQFPVPNCSTWSKRWSYTTRWDPGFMMHFPHGTHDPQIHNRLWNQLVQKINVETKTDDANDYIETKRSFI